MKEGIIKVENMHYDPLFERKRQVLPTIIKEELTQRQRQVILLYYVHKQTDGQIANSLGITTASVKRLRRRAESRIAHYLRYCG